MCTCQCEGLQMGQRNGVLFKEVSAFQRCPVIEASLYTHNIIHAICYIIILCLCLYCTLFTFRAVSYCAYIPSVCTPFYLLGRSWVGCTELSSTHSMGVFGNGQSP